LGFLVGFEVGLGVVWLGGWWDGECVCSDFFLVGFNCIVGFCLVCFGFVGFYFVQCVSFLAACLICGLKEYYLVLGGDFG